MAKRVFIALAVLLTTASIFLFISFYSEAKSTAVSKLNEAQFIHAKQAAQGIEDYFAARIRSLTFLSKIDAIVENNAHGQSYLNLFCEAHKDRVRAITRTDEKGIIIYNFPMNDSIGKDISEQKHIRELLRDHKPVASDAFKSVEGFDTIAVHVPVFKGDQFKGGLGVLIDFESLAKRYFDPIKIGKTGYAGVISRDGTQLYSPVPGMVGKSVLENIKNFPSARVMVTDMLAGHEGTATYTFDRIGSQFVGPTKKYAVYTPIHILNTFWSIAVSSSEKDVLAGLIAFRNKLALVIGALFILGTMFSVFGARAWLIFKEEEKRRQTEKKLQESESRLRDIMFSMVEWMREVDKNGVYTYSSSKGEKVFGNVIGKKLFDFISPDETQRVEAIFSSASVNKKPIKDLESWNICSNGEKICLLTNAVPILDEAGNLQGYRGVDKDITAHKINEREMAILRLELTHLTRVMTMNELSTSLAHEINQPLGAILNNASAAKLLISQAENNSADMSEILTDIIQDAKRAGDVIRKIRGMVKRGDARVELLNIDELIADVLQLCHNSLEINKVGLHIDLQAGHTKIKGDRIQLQQVMLNLIVNALDIMKETPVRKLIVRSHLQTPDTVTVSVSDSGPGIDEEMKTKLFQPFFTTKKDGLGVGLAICQSIILEHGGRIWAEGNSMTGATFSFSLKIGRGAPL